MIEALRVNDLTGKGNGIAFVNHLNFFLMEGEILGITGLHDSGRSTLVNMLCGMVSPSQGEILLAGKGIRLDSIEQAQKMGVFCIRNTATLIPDLSVVENMCLLLPGIRNTMFFPNRRLQSAVCDLLKAMKVDVDVRAKCYSLPVAQLHLVEICRAFFCGARVLILHDIMQSYTQEEERQLYSLLCTLRQRGVAILLTGSRPEQMIGICDRIVTMRQGRASGIFFRDEFRLTDIEKMLMGKEPAKRPDLRGRETSDIVLEAGQLSCESMKAISLDVYSGEIVGLYDAKKTQGAAFMQMLAGRKAIESGVLRVNSQRFGAEQRVHLTQQNQAGYISNYWKDIFPQLTVGENISIAALGQYAHGIHIRKNFEKFAIRECAQTIGIPQEALDKRMYTQGSQMQLEVTLCRWLLTGIRLLVINDLFLGTDIRMKDSIRVFMDIMRARGIGVLIYSSDISSLRDVCDRLIEL